MVTSLFWVQPIVNVPSQHDSCRMQVHQRLKVAPHPILCHLDSPQKLQLRATVQQLSPVVIRHWLSSAMRLSTHCNSVCAQT